MTIEARDISSFTLGLKEKKLTDKAKKELRKDLLLGFTSTVISSIPNFENLSTISRNPVHLLTEIKTPIREALELGLNTEITDKKSALEEQRLRVANFFIQGFEETLTELLSKNEVFTARELQIVKGFAMLENKRNSEGNPFTIQEIKKIIEQRFIDDRTHVRKLSLHAIKEGKPEDRRLKGKELTLDDFRNIRSRSHTTHKKTDLAEEPKPNN